LELHRVNEAERILNKHRFTVLWSGGKDSTAALLWVLDHVKHDNWNILYVEITGNTHRLCTEYVLKTARGLDVEDKLMIARTKNFYELMDRWGPPLMFYRWCLYKLKADGFKYAENFTVDGIRKADSKARRKLSLINISKLFGKISVSPLIDWTKKQVLEYIEKHEVEVNPCYKLYGHSGNCMFCPYADKRHIALTMSDPEWRNKILPTLLKHKEKMMKGSIGRSVYERWVKEAFQTTLTKFMT